MTRKAQHTDSPAAMIFGEFPHFSGQAMKMAVGPLEVWLRWQAGIFDAAGPATAEWIARRREATEATLKAIEKIGSCDDFAEILKIQSDWLEDERKRLWSDMQALGAQGFAWSREVAKVGQTTTEALQESVLAAEHLTHRDAA